VAFEFERPREIKMTVFDVRGRVVATLAEGNWSAGQHTVRWNGKNLAGKQVATGVYLVKMTTVDAEHTIRAVLVK